MSQHPIQTYECGSCGHRVRTNAPPGHCSVCGGEMMNLSIGRDS